MAEREGFEPPEAFTSSVFKTDALNHSTISPQDKKTCVLGHRFDFSKWCSGEDSNFHHLRD